MARAAAINAGERRMISPHPGRGFPALPGGSTRSCGEWCTEWAGSTLSRYRVVKRGGGYYHDSATPVSYGLRPESFSSDESRRTVMAKEKDPAEIIETIAQSIRVSQRGVRKVKAHRFKELFGYQVLNSQRGERIEQLMAEAGIEVRPSLEEAERDDWLVMSMPVEVPVPEVSPDPVPSPEWFAHMASVRTDTEREVEMHFASPLFREGLGYSEDQEAAGFAIQAARGSRPGHIEADLLYFADDKRDVREGE